MKLKILIPTRKKDTWQKFSLYWYNGIHYPITYLLRITIDRRVMSGEFRSTDFLLGDFLLQCYRSPDRSIEVAAGTTWMQYHKLQLVHSYQIRILNLYQEQNVFKKIYYNMQFWNKTFLRKNKKMT